MELGAASRVRGQAMFVRLSGGVRALKALGSRWFEVLVGAPWFALVLLVTLWVWGPTPAVFTTADEATNRLAALLIAKGGRPIVPLPFSDLENLVHLRPWRSLGEQAVPVLPPLTFYLQGWLSRLGDVGYLMISALPATGAAAFAAGMARLLPVGRRWLALLAPALGFPALYWLLRPWMNMALLLSCLCWALFFWARWHASGKEGWLAGALLGVGGAAAVRPDYAAFLLPAALLLTLAARPERWKSALAWTVVAGAGALGVNLVLNRLVIGEAWRGGYQLVAEAEPGAPRSRALQIATLLVAPGGLPSLDDALGWFERYWVRMGPVGLLLAAQLSLLPLLKASKPRARLFAASALVVLFWLGVTRMYAGFNGATEAVGLVNHSIPRYWAPLYWFAAVPPLLFLGRSQRRLVLAAGTALAVALALLGADELYRQQPTSLLYLESFARTKTRWLDSAASSLPPESIVYSAKEDKIGWSRWQVAVIRATDLTVASIQRAVRSGRPVFILARGFPRGHRELARALAAANLSVVRVNRRSDFYRVSAAEPEA